MKEERASSVIVGRVVLSSLMGLNRFSIRITIAHQLVSYPFDENEYSLAELAVWMYELSFLSRSSVPLYL